MKRFCLFLFCAFCAFSRLSLAGDFFFGFWDSANNPQPLRGLLLYPLQANSVNPNGGFTTADYLPFFTGTNGTVICSNLIGQTYMGVFVGTTTNTTNYFTLPQTNNVSAGGTLQYASNFVSNGYVIIGSSVPAYSEVQSDARYVRISSNPLTNGQSNVILASPTLNNAVINESIFALDTNWLNVIESPKFTVSFVQHNFDGNYQLQPAGFMWDGVPVSGTFLAYSNTSTAILAYSQNGGEWAIYDPSHVLFPPPIVWAVGVSNDLALFPSTPAYYNDNISPYGPGRNFYPLGTAGNGLVGYSAYPPPIVAYGTNYSASLTISNAVAYSVEANQLKATSLIYTSGKILASNAIITNVTVSGYLSGNSSTLAVSSNLMTFGLLTASNGITAPQNGYVGAEVFGLLDQAAGPYASVFGDDTDAGDHGVSVGNTASSLSYGVAVGYLANAGSNGLCIGPLGQALGSNSIAIGNGALANSSNAIAIGLGTSVTGPNQVIIGNPQETNTTVYGVLTANWSGNRGTNDLLVNGAGTNWQATNITFYAITGSGAAVGLAISNNPVGTLGTGNGDMWATFGTMPNNSKSGFYWNDANANGVATILLNAAHGNPNGSDPELEFDSFGSIAIKPGVGSSIIPATSGINRGIQIGGPSDFRVWMFLNSDHSVNNGFGSINGTGTSGAPSYGATNTLGFSTPLLFAAWSGVGYTGGGSAEYWPGFQLRMTDTNGNGAINLYDQWAGSDGSIDLNPAGTDWAVSTNLGPRMAFRIGPTNGGLDVYGISDKATPVFQAGTLNSSDSIGGILGGVLINSNLYVDIYAGGTYKNGIDNHNVNGNSWLLLGHGCGNVTRFYNSSGNEFGTIDAADGNGLTAGQGIRFNSAMRIGDGQYPQLGSPVAFETAGGINAGGNIVCSNTYAIYGSGTGLTNVPATVLSAQWFGITAAASTVYYIWPGSFNMSGQTSSNAIAGAWQAPYSGYLSNFYATYFNGGGTTTASSNVFATIIDSTSGSSNQVKLAGAAASAGSTANNTTVAIPVSAGDDIHYRIQFTNNLAFPASQSFVLNCGFYH